MLISTYPWFTGFKNHVYLVNPVKYLSWRMLSVCNEATPYVTSPNVTERAELCPFNMLSFYTASRNGNR